MRTLTSNNLGFTLVELLVALIIMIVGVLGLLQAVNIAMQTNTQNQMRNEAVQLGDIYMNELRIKPFTKVSTAYTNFSVPSRQKNVQKKFTIARTGAKFGAYSTSRELVVQVRWSYKNKPTALELRTIRSKD